MSAVATAQLPQNIPKTTKVPPMGRSALRSSLRTVETGVCTANEALGADCSAGQRVVWVRDLHHIEVIDAGKV